MADTVQLSRFTSFRMGGSPRRYYRPADTEELRAALRECQRDGLQWRILGGGSNLLVDDGDLPCAVIHVVEPAFDDIERTGETALWTGAGTRTARLLAFCRKGGLGGLEFLAGLPGTVGGAVAGNAGAWGRAVSDRLSRLWLMTPDGRSQVRRAEEADFAYRSARLENAVVLGAELNLEKREPELVARRMAENVRRRAQRHPLGQSSAGCVFKNPPGRSAGRLLDDCGLKGRRIGGAEVSHVHANFIVNRGYATSTDILQLIQQMQEAVLARYGVKLELEIKHWSADTRAA